MLAQLLRIHQSVQVFNGVVMDLFNFYALKVE